MTKLTSRSSSRTTDRDTVAVESLSVTPNHLHSSEFRFLLGSSQKRIGGALGLSFASHIVAFLVFLVLLGSIEEDRVSQFEPNRRNYSLVWIPQDGLGGGGGGGGNESLQMPREVELPGSDELSVPVVEELNLEEELSLDEPLEEEDSPLEQRLNISAIPMSAAEESLPGILEGLSTLSMESQGPGLLNGAGTGEGTGIGAGQGEGLGEGEGGGVGGGIYRPGVDVENPRVIDEVTPKYTAEAMRAKVQGVVWLDAVVLPDGTVGDVQIVKSLDPVFGLDEEAIKAARRWRFIPGTRFGEPVSVLVTIELAFTLR